MTRRIHERVTPTLSTRIVVDGEAVTHATVPTPPRTVRALERLSGLLADPALWRGDILPRP